MVLPWREFLHDLSEGLVLRAGSSTTDLANAEARLGVRFPHDLTALLAETDGFYDSERDYECAWPVARIVGENTLRWLDHDAPLDEDLLGFGEDGAGGWFCMPHGPGSTASVYQWAWIERTRHLVAPDLRTFWQGWFTGRITV
jgi:hypothetical protein